MPEVPLSGADIRAYLHEVAAALPVGGPQYTVIVVGGSLLALHDLREATADVDTVRRIRAQLRAAVAQVAEAHGLAPMWLNDSAAAFAPATLEESECELLHEHPQLRVLGAPMAQVFVMKLYAGRARDVEDLIAMWPHCGFESPDEAVRLFWEAYPHAPEDPQLIILVRGIAEQAG